MSQCRRFLIHGKVQGVWFRESTRRQATALGLSGYAKNLPDGRVEVIACGAQDAVRKLADWLHKGPPLARVDGVEESASELTPPADFTTG